MHARLKNKTVVITGAGSGIGRALALEYAKYEVRLALNDFDAAGLNETLEILSEQSNCEVIGRVFDVADKEAIFAFAEEIKSHWGNVHTIVNNAGINGYNRPSHKMTAEDYRHVMEVNFFGVINGCQAFLPHLIENQEGAIVNISSVFGLVGIPNCSDYCASKFAVRGYTESLAVEFYDSPISIHCVHPGGIATNIAKNSNAEKFENKYLKTPPEDIAKYIVQSVLKGKVRIVYGTDSFKLRLLEKLLPKKLQNYLIWNELQQSVDLTDYQLIMRKNK